MAAKYLNWNFTGFNNNNINIILLAVEFIPFANEFKAAIYRKHEKDAAAACFCCKQHLLQLINNCDHTYW